MMNESLYLMSSTASPDVFLTTWNHIYAVSAFATVAGMIGGAAIMYARLYLNGDLVGRQPRRQKHRHTPLDEDLDETDEQTDQATL